MLTALGALTLTVGCAAPGSGPMAGLIVSTMAIYCVAYGLMQSWWLALLFLAWATAKAARPSKTELSETQLKVGR